MKNVVILVCVCLLVPFLCVTLAEIDDISYEEAYVIARDALGTNPDTVAAGMVDGRRAIAVFVNEGEGAGGFVRVLHEIAGVWLEYYSERLYCFSLDELEFVSLDKKPFLYLSYLSCGASNCTPWFDIVDLQEKADWSIRADCGDYYGIQFTRLAPVSDELSKRPVLVAFLEEKLASSELVYHSKPEDFDLDLPQNATKRWLVENPDVIDKLAAETGEAIPLKLFWYHSDILALKGGSRNDSLESSKYIVVTLFKRGAICIDKQTGESCVLLPRIPYRGFEGVRFAAADEVSLTDKDAQKEYAVNIGEGTVSAKNAEFKKLLNTIEKKEQDERKKKEAEEKERARLANLNNTGMWTIKYYVDAFGEETKTAYITNTDRIHGSFSNTATQDSKLDVTFLIDKPPVISMKLFEYAGSNPLKVISKEIYTVYVQDKDGERQLLYAENHSDRLTLDVPYLDEAGSRKLHNALLKGGTLKFRIRDASRSVYDFTIQNADGYENALRKLQEQY